MDCREFTKIGVQTIDPKLYKAAMEGELEVLTSIVTSIEAPNLTLCLTPQKNTLLHIAVEYGHQNIVEKVIQVCPSLIFQCNSECETPLHVAARAGCLDLTKLLTDGVKLNLKGEQILLGEGNFVRQVLMMKNLKGCNPIHEALKKSHGEVALHMLKFEHRHVLADQVNMAGVSLLYLAAEAGLERVVKKIIDGTFYSSHGPDGQNPLHIAVIKGELGVVNILREEDKHFKDRNFIPQADRFGNTALHYASAKSYCMAHKNERLFPDEQIQILQLLLGANPSLAYVPNKSGDYPLFIAVRNDFGPAVGTILEHCPDAAELVNQKGQNALHLAVLEKRYGVIYTLIQFKKLINEPDNDGNTPMHIATLTKQQEIVNLLIDKGTVDLTLSNKEGLTAMDICGTETKHPIGIILRTYGAVPSRHRWQEGFPIPSARTRRLLQIKKISPEFKKLGLQTLPIVTSLVATVTFAAAFTVPGGYKNDGPREGSPVFLRKAALQAFVLSDILAFCSSMTATILLVYANARSEDAFKIYWTLRTCYYISGVAILSTIIAFVTAVFVLTSKGSLLLAVTSLVLGFAVLLFLLCFRWILKKQKWKLSSTVLYMFGRSWRDKPNHFYQFDLGCL